MLISEFLEDDHRQCDAHFAELDVAVHRGDWSGAADALSHFTSSTLRHFQLEEDIVFPEFEAATGQTTGPTQVMRLEHADMRELLADMQQAVREHDRAATIGIGETLLMLLQQHNAKEEQVLYPMLDRLLGGMQGELLERLRSAFRPAA